MLRKTSRSGNSGVPSGVNLKALDSLAHVIGQAAVIGRGPGLVVKLMPIGDWRMPEWDFRAFDDAVCQTGLERFLRPLSAADLATLRVSQLDPPAWVFVGQSCGYRFRTGVRLYDPARN